MSRVGVVVCAETAKQGDESVVRLNAASTEEDSNYNRSVVCHMKVALLFPLLVLQQLHHKRMERVTTRQHGSSRTK